MLLHVNCNCKHVELATSLQQIILKITTTTTITEQKITATNEKKMLQQQLKLHLNSTEDKTPIGKTEEDSFSLIYLLCCKRYTHTYT